MKLKATMLFLGLCFALSVVAARPADAQLSGPEGLAFGSNGTLWVANSGANQVLELNPSNGKVLHKITKSINAPLRLAFDSLGNLWVVNGGNGTITGYNKKLQLFSTYSEAGSGPLGVAVDAYGDTYIANNQANDIVALNVGFGRLVETLTQDKSGFPFTSSGALAINGRNLYAGFGSGDSEDAVISYNVGEFLTHDPKEITLYNDNVNTGPTGIAFDSQGNVYISCLYSGTAVKYKLGKGSKPVLVISQAIGGPEGIAVDTSGKIYVSNSSYDDITVYNSSGKLINTLD
jgi:DNA-binding beta-propeller fold protein YncE